MDDLTDYLRQIISPHAPGVIQVEGVPHMILPHGYTAKPMPELLEREAPARIRRKVQAHDIRGFVDYVNEFKVLNFVCSRIYAGPVTAPTIEARLDDHGINAPSNVTHLCTFGCPTTHEWRTWTGKNRQAFGQVEFAEFIEENIRDVMEPSGADLLAATLDFSDSGSADFRKAVRLSDGRIQFSYVQNGAASNVEFPNLLKLGLPVFEGVPTLYAVSARLRWRLKETDLKLWYELDRPDLTLRLAHDALIEKIGAETGLQVYRAV